MRIKWANRITMSSGGPAEAGRALGTIGLANACILARGAFCRLKIKSTRESKK
jgi:hypothetical protein